jgi:hypothetical protein
MLTAREVFDEAVRRLPPPERLRLAAMILEELTRAIPPATGEGDLPGAGVGEESEPAVDEVREAWAELGMSRLEAEWDNAGDALYDDWKRLYGV